MKFKKALTIEIDEQKKSDEEILSEKVIMELNTMFHLTGKFLIFNFQD